MLLNDSPSMTDQFDVFVLNVEGLEGSRGSEEREIQERAGLKWYASRGCGFWRR